MRILFIVCGAWLLTLSAIGCGQPDTKDPSSAIDDLLSVDLSHVDPEVRSFLSRKQRAARASADSSSAIGELSMAYEMNGFTDAALVGYRHAASLAPTNFKWPYYEGLVLASFGDYENALNAIQRAIAIDETYAPSWIWKGRWHLELNESNDATVAFGHAFDLGLNDAASVGLAQVALRKDEAELALSYLQTFDQNDPHPHVVRLVNSAQLRLGLAGQDSSSRRIEAVGQIGFPDRISAEKRAYEISISAELARFRNLLMRPDGRSAAFEIVDSLYQKHPNNKRVVIAKAHRLRLEGDATKLRTLLSESIATWPTEINFILGLAELEIDAQNSMEALRLIETALALEPDNAWGLLQKGIAQAQQGEFENVVESLRHALLFDESAEIHYYLGHAYAELADFSSARCHMNRAVELVPEFTQARDQLRRLDDMTQGKSPIDIGLEGCLRNEAN